MTKLYITGISGVGKSTLVKELLTRGIEAFDIDAVPNLCHWKEKFTDKKAEYRPGIGKDWLEAHDWVCDPIKLKELVDKNNANIVVAGIASNQLDYLNLFDKVFLLHCDKKTLLQRLNSRKENDFAKERSEQKYVLDYCQDFEEKMNKQGAIPIDAESDINAVANQISSYI